MTREKNELEDQLKRAKQDADNRAAVKDGESALNKRVTELTQECSSNQITIRELEDQIKGMKTQRTELQAQFKA